LSYRSDFGSKRDSLLNRVYSQKPSSRFIVARSSWIGHSRRNIAEVAGNRQLGIEISLLVSLLRDLVLRNRSRSKLTDELKGIKISIFALLSMALGYFLELFI
jgi:hypothetical protein